MFCMWCISACNTGMQASIDNAHQIARDSGIALEKALDSSKAPVLAIASYVTVQPSWPDVEANFDTLAGAISKSYKFYEVEALPHGLILAQHLPWQNLTGEALHRSALDVFSCLSLT